MAETTENRYSGDDSENRVCKILHGNIDEGIAVCDELRRVCKALEYAEKIVASRMHPQFRLGVARMAMLLTDTGHDAEPNVF